MGLALDLKCQLLHNMITHNAVVDKYSSTTNLRISSSIQGDDSDDSGCDNENDAIFKFELKQKNDPKHIKDNSNNSTPESER